MARVMKQDNKLREKFQELIDKKIAEQSANKGNEIPDSLYTIEILSLFRRKSPKVKIIISPELKGEIGEFDVANNLENCLSDNWIIFNNILIEVSESLVQIDHLVIGLTGIFIIETKSWRGSCSGYQDEWKRRERDNWVECHSPTLQNARQATLLKEWLQKSNFTNLPTNLNKYITPVVVFTVARWVKVTKCSTLVFENIESLIGYLKNQKNNYLTLEQVNQIAYLIANYPSERDFQNQSQLFVPPLSLDEADRYEQEAISKAKQGRYQEAIEDFTNALKINPCSTRTYRYRGVAHSRLGDIKGAVADLREAAILCHKQEKLTAHQQLLEEIKKLETSTNDQLQLASAVGNDYTKLRNLLAAGEWLEADKETFNIMLKATPEKISPFSPWTERKHISTTAIDNFPCSDLRTIDQLWTYYSKGHFGFSVQKPIWESVDKNFHKFMIAVGWAELMEFQIIPTAIPYDKLTFSLNAPQGHLPVGAAFQYGTALIVLSGRERELSHLLSRLDTCKIFSVSPVQVNLQQSALNQDPQSTDPIVGVYFWFNGHTIELRTDRVIYRQAFILQRACGTWERNPSGTYTLTWSEGEFIDTLTLSSDRSTLYGTNQLGDRVTGAKIK